MNKIYITIENIDKKFTSIEDAVKYADENFDSDIESFELNIFSDDGKLIDWQTVERNPYSGDFVYAAWVFSTNKYDDSEDTWEFDGGSYDTLEQLLKDPDYLAAKSNGYRLKVELITQTTYETIGDVVDTYEEEK